ncbi:hypothetical protein [Lactiplantibacillus mudanjiangensis]|uniref:hypothetical protein n=1 Tax=Lactiplantibacillus mudanjiangensis TaxID=1296538 RepID=UPI0013EF1DB4|nr:hypothetical protein [Lactiplantibacillus mudanjiangensis]
MSRVLVPIMIVVAIGLMAIVHGHQGWQFMILVVALLGVDQSRPGRWLNHWVVQKLNRS